MCLQIVHFAFCMLGSESTYVHAKSNTTAVELEGASWHPSLQLPRTPRGPYSWGTTSWAASLVACLGDSHSNQSVFPRSDAGWYLVHLSWGPLNCLFESSQVQFLRGLKEKKWFQNTSETVFRISVASHDGELGTEAVLALFFLPKRPRKQDKVYGAHGFGHRDKRLRGRTGTGEVGCLINSVFLLEAVSLLRWGGHCQQPGGRRA